MAVLLQLHGAAALPTACTCASAAAARAARTDSSTPLVPPIETADVTHGIHSSDVTLSAADRRVIERLTPGDRALHAAASLRLEMETREHGLGCWLDGDEAVSTQKAALMVEAALAELKGQDQTKAEV